VRAGSTYRHTFVVQVHADGISTLENLGTHERIRVSDMSAVGPQIERWLSGPIGRDRPASGYTAGNADPHSSQPRS
jgi:hypothetical protein